MPNLNTSISSDVLSTLISLNLALVSADDAGLIRGDYATDFFTDVLIAAGVDAEWWCEEGQFLIPSAETVGGKC